MREQLIDDVAARRFLLGQLPPEEQGRIEELAFEDPDTFTFLESIEDDLIDEFIQGDLSADQEQQFNGHFLSLPGRRHNLKISRMLQRHLDKIADVPRRKRFSFLGWFRLQTSWLKLSMAAAAALVLVIGILWILTLFWRGTKPVPIQAGPDRPAAMPSPPFKVSPSVAPTAAPAHAENKPKSLTPERQKGLTAYALLSPSASSRSEGVQQLSLAQDTTTMTIELALITQRNFRTYQATLENEAGGELQRWTNLTAENLTSGRALKIDVPTALLKPQEFYRIVVNGVASKGEAEVIARYPFEVSK
ncbi:MAG TPA: hypothetical protein VGO56_10780 [Pyrinomonadaceae bacterium]|jgi:hypothetical protein|nr:hypothetical protein [Pyrinomonadaceae bacterium]